MCFEDGVSISVILQVWLRLGAMELPVPMTATSGATLPKLFSVLPQLELGYNVKENIVDVIARC